MDEPITVAQFTERYFGAAQEEIPDACIVLSGGSLSAPGRMELGDMESDGLNWKIFFADGSRWFLAPDDQIVLE